MKQLYLVFLAFFISFSSIAQLKADAGADKVWCKEYGEISGPVLGGNPSADQGMPPYTYSWFEIYSGYVAQRFLDTVTSPNPRITDNSMPLVDSLLFVLEVTDAQAKKAYDTVRVYVNRWFCPLGENVIYKAAQDTVSLRTYACRSAFGPNVFMYWRPALDLLDSTVEAARCWTPVSRQYTAYVRNQIGCVNKSFCYVEVAPTGIVKLPSVPDEVSIYPNPITAQSKVVCTPAWIGGTFTLFSMDGKLVERFELSELETSLSTISNQNSGIYFYQVKSLDGKVKSGKILFN